MESTGAHGMDSGGLRHRRPHRTTEAKTIRVVSLLGHQIFRLELDLTETIAKVKAMIYEQEGTHPTQQVLIFRQQRLNDDHRTLADYGVQHGPSSSLFLDTRLHAGDPLEFLSPPSSDVESGSENGSSSSNGEKSDDDEYEYMDTDEEQSSNQKEGTGSHSMEAMASEGLRRPSQGAKSIIVRQLTGSTIKLEEVYLSETIKGVKDMIYEKTGIPPAYQRFVFNGKEFHKEWYTLEKYGFQYGEYIHLVDRLRGGGPDSKINIFITKLDGETFTVMLSSLCPIYQVRRMIHEQEGIRQRQQHLVFRGQPLDDDRTLADYNIQENSTLHLAPGPCGGNSVLHEPLSKDEDGLVKTGQAASSEITEEPPSMAARVNDTALSDDQFNQQKIPWSKYSVKALVVAITTFVTYLGSASTLFSTGNMGVGPGDQFIKQQKIRWSKYSVKALVFAITTFATYLGSASTLFSTGNMVFKISIGAFFIAYATLSIMMPPKLGSALVYLSCFLLVLVSYLLLLSFNKYYGYAILPVLLPIVAALLQHKLRSGLQNVDTEASGQAHHNGEEDEGHFDCIFDLSADIVNCGGLIIVVFGNSMVGPVSAVGFLFFYTMALGLYLMMVTTVRDEVLTPHARYLSILLKILLAITLITSLIHGVRRSNVSSA